jgi:hypothetical protein
VDSKHFEKATFLIRAKLDLYTLGSEGGENKVKFYLIKYVKHTDHFEEMDMLLERLKRFQTMQ